MKKTLYSILLLLASFTITAFGQMIYNGSFEEPALNLQGSNWATSYATGWVSSPSNIKIPHPSIHTGDTIHIDTYGEEVYRFLEDVTPVDGDNFGLVYAYPGMAQNFIVPSAGMYRVSFYVNAMQGETEYPSYDNSHFSLPFIAPSIQVDFGGFGDSDEKSEVFTLVRGEGWKKYSMTAYLSHRIGWFSIVEISTGQGGRGGSAIAYDSVTIEPIVTPEASSSLLLGLSGFFLMLCRRR